MSDFAFRRTTPLFAPAEAHRSKTGLWSAHVEHPSGRVTKRGYLSKAEAKAALNDHSQRALGRTPLYVH